MAVSDPLVVPLLLGPTASGKTSLACALAEKYGWEIISCDSRQVYRFLDIGTAKPTAHQRERVPHWLIDIKNPDEPYSVHAFVSDALSAIHDCFSRGKRALVCGGTGLYAESLRQGIGPQVESDPAIRDELMQRAVREEGRGLHEELAAKDPESAARIHANDVQRIVRALAVHYQTGHKLSDLHRTTRPPEGILFLPAVLMPPRDLLYERINARVDAMASAGLWEEFRAVRAKGCKESAPGMQCVGYRELFAVERGECTLKTALDNIKQNTRRYAKRQITWFSSRNAAEILVWSDDESDHIRKAEAAFACG